jgi:predicted peptidase
MNDNQIHDSFSTKVTREVTVRYLLALPEGYTKDGPAQPLMVFLHGAGERGSDLELVKRHGPPKLIAAGKRFPFIIVSPQLPEEESWSVEAVSALIDRCESLYRIDKTRIYLTGLSMGGNGTWRLAMAEPTRFAAIAPICGWGDSTKVCILKDIPIWNFHGARDLVVPIAKSQVLINALEACGADVTFTVYPDAGHDAWTATYDHPALYEWFLQHQQK